MEKIQGNSYYNKEIVKFGFLLMREWFIFCGLGSLLALSLNMPIEYVIILLTYFFVRSYTGGAHMGSYLGCLVCSCTLIYIILWLAKNVSISIRFSVMVTVVVSAILAWMGPIECETRKIEHIQRKMLDKRLKKNLFFLMVIVCCLYIIKKYLYIKVIGLSLVSILISCIIQKYILLKQKNV